MKSLNIKPYWRIIENHDYVEVKLRDYAIYGSIDKTDYYDYYYNHLIYNPFKNVCLSNDIITILDNLSDDGVCYYGYKTILRKYDDHNGHFIFRFTGKNALKSALIFKLSIPIP